MQAAEAREIWRDLEVSSELVLEKLNLPSATTRTRPWRSSGGPEGIAYHYTGGKDGIRTLRWFLDPAWGNKVSSAQILIFDTIPDVIWKTWTIGPASILFPVPVIVMAPLSVSTWCTNWINNRCMGVELRNVGPTANLGELRGGRRWERYTRDQIVAAIRIGQVLRALRGEAFRPELVVGHHMIWATKDDPGPLFPLHNVRAAIVSDEEPNLLPWVQTPLFPEARTALLSNRTTPATRTAADYRGDPEATEESWHADLSASRAPVNSDELGRLLYSLGWAAWPKPPGGMDTLTNFVTYYQRSTLAWKPKRPTRVLKVDGVFGPLTRASMEARVESLAL